MSIESNNDLTLKQKLITILKVPKENIKNYQSDLLILWSEEIETWLKNNYEYPRNILMFYGNVEGSDWHKKKIIEIPFGFDEFRTKKINLINEVKI
jgi:hypothetical protein